MSLATRLSIAAALVIAAPLGMLLIDRGLTPGAAEPPNVDFADWPTEIGSWRGEPTTLDPRLVERSGALVMTSWLYRTASQRPIVVNYGVWNEYHGELPHEPTRCWPGAGWELIETRDVTIPGERLPSWSARLLLFARNAERTAVLYWYEVGDTVLVDRGELRRLKQDLRGRVKTFPLAAKYMLHTDARDAAAAETRLVDFAGQLRPAAAGFLP